MGAAFGQCCLQGCSSSSLCSYAGFRNRGDIEQKSVELKLWPELVLRQRLHTIWLIRLRRRPLMKSDEMCPMAFIVIVILVAISNGGRIFGYFSENACNAKGSFERRVGITDCPTKIYLTKDCSNWIVIKDRQPKFVF